MSLVVGIDASRNRSGGAKARLVGILASVDPTRHDILKIHVWAFQSLLNSIPDRPWLVKHNPLALEQSLAKQLWWQAVHLSKEAEEVQCDILFTTDASTVCRFKPMVVLSQDMLSYEPNVMRNHGYGYARMRLLTILYLQNAAFRRAEGVIFLTRYAGQVIQGSCGSLSRVAFIPHGVSQIFSNTVRSLQPPLSAERPIRCLYVSPVSRYKHQWVVVQAIEALRQRGISITLDLIGGGDGTAHAKLRDQIERSDPAGIFIRQVGGVRHNSLPSYLANADIFVFASSCENMPVTLLEAMAVGLPIACSNRGPMPEVLEDGGVYFDPEDPASIAHAIEQIITDDEICVRIAQRAKALSSQYSWQRCADETFAFIVETYKLGKNIQS